METLRHKELGLLLVVIGNGEDAKRDSSHWACTLGLQLRVPCPTYLCICYLNKFWSICRNLYVWACTQLNIWFSFLTKEL